MPTNTDILIPLLVKEYRELDFGEYAEHYRGQKLSVWVNAPAVIEEIMTRARDDNSNYDAFRASVAILFELPLEKVQHMDDVLMLWLFGEGTKAYNEFHEDLRKNSSGGS